MAKVNRSVPAKKTKASANVFAGAIAGLSGGVEALFAGDQADMFPVSLDLIDTKSQVREEFEDEDNTLQEMADSIKALGVISPIFLRPVGERFELVAGERRLRGARLAGLDKIPALVRALTDEQSAQAQLAENIQRKNLTQMELAKRLRADIERLGSVEAVLPHYQKSRSWVSKILAFNDLPEQSRRLVAEGITSDAEIISAVRQIEKRDAQAAREVVDDLKASWGQGGDARKKVETVRNRVKPASNERKQTDNLLADVYTNIMTLQAPKNIVSALTPEERKACAGLKVQFDAGSQADAIAQHVLEGVRMGVFGKTGAPAMRLAAFLIGFDQRESVPARFQLPEVIKALQAR